MFISGIGLVVLYFWHSWRMKCAADAGFAERNAEIADLQRKLDEALEKLDECDCVD